MNTHEYTLQTVTSNRYAILMYITGDLKEYLSGASIE